MVWKNPLTSYICAEQEAQPHAWNNENVLGTLGYETAVFILPHNHMVWSNRLQTGVWETFLCNTYSFKQKDSPLCEATRTSFARAQMYFCKANLQTDLNGKIRIKWGSAKSQFVFPSPQWWLTAKKSMLLLFVSSKQKCFDFGMVYIHSRPFKETWSTTKEFVSLSEKKKRVFVWAICLQKCI